MGRLFVLVLVAVSIIWIPIIQVILLSPNPHQECHISSKQVLIVGLGPDSDIENLEISRVYLCKKKVGW